MKTAQKSLNDQLLEARLTPFLKNHSIQGGTICFAWPERKLGVAIVDKNKIGLSAISNDWTIYQVTPNQAKNGDARQMIEMMLTTKRG